jgi:hypothetical protein
MKRNYSLTQNFNGGLNELNEINNMVVEASQYHNRNKLYEVFDMSLVEINEAPESPGEFKALSNFGSVFIICKN